MLYVNELFRGITQVLVWIGFTVLMVGLIIILSSCLILVIDVLLDTIKQSTTVGPIYKKIKKKTTKKSVKLYEKMDKPSHKEEL